MLRSDLVAKLIEENPDLEGRDLERIVGTVLDEIAEALAQGNRVELRGLAPSLFATERPAKAVTPELENRSRWPRNLCRSFGLERN